MNPEITNNASQTNLNSTQVVETSKKCKHLPIIIILSILAVAGLGFGGFELWQNIQKDSQIAELKNQVDYLNNSDRVMSSGGSQDSNLAKRNPIISATAPMVYDLGFASGGLNSSLSISLRDGEISSCSVDSVDSKWVGDNDGGIVKNRRYLKDCEITGIESKIYKIVEIGEGQDSLYDSVAFIMEDGSVEYFSLNDALERSDFSIDGKLKIDGFVTDAFTVNVWKEGATGGYGSTIFVLSDGSYVKYDVSMLN